MPGPPPRRPSGSACSPWDQTRSPHRPQRPPRGQRRRAPARRPRRRSPPRRPRPPRPAPPPRPPAVGTRVGKKARRPRSTCLEKTRSARNRSVLSGRRRCRWNSRLRPEPWKVWTLRAGSGRSRWPRPSCSPRMSAPGRPRGSSGCSDCSSWLPLGWWRA
ncbi:hypothetical protein B8X03_09650 [Micrococcus luteus]|nr:hypothetical protein B8X03_09650 [Micrococcus luteus]